MQKNRMIRNYITDATLQFRFAAMAVGTFLIMVAVVIGYSYIYLDKIMFAIFEIPDIPEDAIAIYESMVGGYFFGMAMLLISLCCFAVAIMVVQMHKIAGAKFAIIRHIKEDMQKFRFDRSIKLRDSDYLQDLAFEVNRLCEMILSKGVLLPEAGDSGGEFSSLVDANTIKTSNEELAS
jgi:hypothetical protein